MVLIGPGCAGKSTVARAVGDRTDLTALDLDEVRWDYYNEIDYDPEHASSLSANYAMLTEYWKPFETHSVERVLADHPTGHVIAFGAGPTVQADRDLFARVRTALADFPVVLLQPSPDPDESWQVLRERVEAMLREDEVPERTIASYQILNRGFIDSADDASLADEIVYTNGCTVDETADEVVARLGL